MHSINEQCFYSIQTIRYGVTIDILFLFVCGIDHKTTNNRIEFNDRKQNY